MILNTTGFSNTPRILIKFIYNFKFFNIWDKTPSKMTGEYTNNTFEETKNDEIAETINQIGDDKNNESDCCINRDESTRSVCIKNIKSDCTLDGEDITCHVSSDGGDIGKDSVNKDCTNMPEMKIGCENPHEIKNICCEGDCKSANSLETQEIIKMQDGSGLKETDPFIEAKTGVFDRTGVDLATDSPRTELGEPTLTIINDFMLNEEKNHLKEADRSKRKGGIFYRIFRRMFFCC